MNSVIEPQQASIVTDKSKPVLNIIVLILTLFVFLVSLDLMSLAFKLFGKETAEQIISVTSNPFVGLFIGLLATATLQSSSTVTSMVVAMVASGSITIPNAVPLIIGANIGTSVTSTIVALGHLGKRKEYAKAVSAATVHDFFNIIVASILFPMEYFFGLLTKSSVYLASLFDASPSGEESSSWMKVVISPVSKFISISTGSSGTISLLLAGLLLFFSLRMLTTLLKKILIGKVYDKMDSYLFKSPVRALTWGMLSTAAVQSSSVTTSLIVPLVASGKVKLSKAFPFLMGSNIGTTVTALIASMSNGEAALSIAFAHVLFNLFGVMILFPIKPVREIPVMLSVMLGKATLRQPLIGIGYIVVVFFLIPFILIYFNR